MLDKNFFVMRCSSYTKRSVLKHNIFAAPEKDLEKLKKIKNGDILFLYNVSSNELYGIFEAVSEVRLYIDSSISWSDRFPVQVKVRKISNKLLSLDDAKGIFKEFKLLRKAYHGWAGYVWYVSEYELTKDQGLKLLKYFEEKYGSLQEIWNYLHSDAWKLQGIKPFKWQIEAFDNWKKNNYRGIVQVATGAGKTFFAAYCIEKLMLNEFLGVIVIVPSVALMEQWHNKLKEYFNLKDWGDNDFLMIDYVEEIGRFGGGYKEPRVNNKDLLIFVDKSAQKHLLKVISEWIDQGRKIFLVLDEVHKFGSKKNLQLLEELKEKIDYSLGLTAYFDRDLVKEEKKVVEIIGDLIYELTIDEAVNEGYLSDFEISILVHLLQEDDEDYYNYYSKRIAKIINDLDKKYSKISFLLGLTETGDDELISKIKKISSELCKQLPTNKGLLIEYDLLHLSESERKKICQKIKEFQSLTHERWKLIFHSRERYETIEHVIRRIIKKYQNAKILIFTEYIDHAEQIYSICKKLGLYDKTIIKHSKSDAGTKGVLKLFNEGKKQILISVKQFSEGIDFPDAEFGIIASSKNSPRQLIQTVGRLLRKSNNNRKKFARIFYIMAKDTIDEKILERIDWNKTFGKRYEIIDVRYDYYDLNF